ncbi:tetraacyldisaccharide 4'-kinase [Chitinophaga pendula]|uniref:tetraacyldisaccharide 4'-kinase n=1 Tax=Chitinophaga pendula TaxID=2849666 RepID=UPI001CED051D|nr:tetraacyldisaccharide 4'-kinase [Chitinophaga pendula]UCJ09182.1 tetraacyldisaccharide 4'-kinase [Chitinophaga pendula]
MLSYLKILLYPFSMLYGLIMWIRNRLYDNGALTAVEFEIPTIAVGNLSVGGTGKTPHVEYLIRLLKQFMPIATLSRGYNRRTKGFVLAGPNTTAAEIGDEPMQFHQKFPDISVCVGEERMLAIPELLGERPYIATVLLDDAFQHRSIKPGLNIMLTDYSRLFTRDHIVPFGRLREGRNGYHRADCIIVSKCPPTLSTADQAALRKEIAPLPHQQLFFTSLQYGQQYPMLPLASLPPVSADTTILLVCGIARPEPLVQHLKENYRQVFLLPFADHHYYTNGDLEKIQRELEDLPGQQKLIVTTEKDAVRLSLLQEQITARNWQIAIIPVEISFLFDEQVSFNNYIFDYIQRKYTETEGAPAYHTGQLPDTKDAIE